jgi:hypothetical protein
MAFSHGSSAALYVNDIGGTERNISTYLSSTGLNRQRDTAETSALSSTAKSYIPGLIDGTFPLEGHYDPTVDGYLAGLFGQTTTPAAFKYFPAGSASGAIYYQGSAWLTSYELSSSVDDRNAITGELQVTAGITRGTA